MQTGTNNGGRPAKDLTEEDRRRLSGSVMGLIEKRGLDREALLAQIREQLAGNRV